MTIHSYLFQVLNMALKPHVCLNHLILIRRVLAEYQDLSTGLFAFGLPEISEADILDRALPPPIDFFTQEYDMTFCRYCIVVFLSLLISLSSGCSSSGRVSDSDRQQTCNMVKCIERNIEYRWDSQLKNYVPKDVGCKTYDVNTECVYHSVNRKKEVAGTAAVKPAVVFSEVSCVRRLVKRTRHTVPQAQALCRKSVKNISKDSNIRLIKDNCIKKSVRSGMTVREAIENCYY